MSKYPSCSQCGHILNPNLEDDCEKYYIINGEIYCQCCFEDWLKDGLYENMDTFAESLGIPMVYVRSELYG